MSTIRAFAFGLVDLLAPARCPGCDAAMEAERPGFCAGCAALLEPASGGEAALRYGGPLRDGLHRLKYEGRRDLADALASRLVEHALARLVAVDAVVPVPLHRRRLVERGFNQAALLAAPVARALGARFSPGRLARLRDTPAQVGLGGSARRRNVAGAFRARSDPRRPRVLLVDDVRTTGATLAEAAVALKDAGAGEVHVLALAQSDGD
jgi:ComF family protein